MALPTSDSTTAEGTINNDEDSRGFPLTEDQLYKPYFGERCRTCGMKLSCNGCSRCGKCETKEQA